MTSGHEVKPRGRVADSGWSDGGCGRGPLGGVSVRPPPPARWHGRERAAAQPLGDAPVPIAPRYATAPGTGGARRGQRGQRPPTPTLRQFRILAPPAAQVQHSQRLEPRESSARCGNLGGTPAATSNTPFRGKAHYEWHEEGRGAFSSV